MRDRADTRPDTRGGPESAAPLLLGQSSLGLPALPIVVGHNVLDGKPGSLRRIAEPERRAAPLDD